MLGSLIGFVLDHWQWLSLLGGPLALLPFAGKILGFLGGNWKWALPALAFVVLGAWSIDRTVRVANLRAEIAQGIAERAQAVIDQKERDRLLAIAISAELADQNARTAGTVTTRTEAVNREKVAIPSLDTPAMRQSDDGLLELGFRRATRSGAGAPGDPSAAPVNGPGKAE